MHFIFENNVTDFTIFISKTTKKQKQQKIKQNNNKKKQNKKKKKKKKNNNNWLTRGRNDPVSLTWADLTIPFVRSTVWQFWVTLDKDRGQRDNIIRNIWARLPIINDVMKPHLWNISQIFAIW